MTATDRPPFRPARRSWRLLALLPAAGLIAGCEGPLDYDLRGQIGAFNTTEAAQGAAPGRPAPDSRGLITYPTYQVAVANRGDTVADVAARAGLPAAEIARFNGMQPADPLRQGEVLALPRRAPASTQPGAVDIASLAGQAIDSAPQSQLQSGRVTTTPIAPAPAAAPAAKPNVQAGPEPVRHKVERGETAYTISRLYQVPVKSLAEWNGLGSDFAVREGQYLLIPVASQSAPARPVAVVTQPGSGSSTPTPPSAVKPLPQETVAPAAAPAAQPPKVDVPAPSRASDAAMAYPVQGKIIRPYAKGKNDGIDISAAAGSKVMAAEAGTVAAITQDSNKVPIIVIRHDQKLLTVYANVDGITVNKGDRVQRGQTIAALRQASTPYLHFEVRDGFDSVDPLPYLN